MRVVATYWLSSSKRHLLRAERTVPGVAEPGNDVPIVVELLINHGRVYAQTGVLLG